ncbi:DUF4429 domain-containing protein [Streptomyces sp. NPDC017201]|uniref:DUF4429 domain-containing protein n=1 Tax=unclassified Streptomyces TaxID=2593676 RepID=UPI002E2D366C|nr:MULTISPECIES: DUF4429 domain-containing protein [unclassified Streptomyces]WSS63512.1 DUF4429 domain-containing protein [Streptomyces sp. NBC_01177]WSS70506.1 DUF4429 domain-containing protein [Streptomyces sp. NBC_01175]
MADIISRDGTWSFDGDTVRIVPGGKAHPVRQGLGELAVPLHAVAGASFEPDRKGGRLRLRLRTGACPVLRAADGRLKDASDPYQLVVEKDRTGVAEYLVDEIRNALLIEQVPEGPVDRFLLPGPSVPVSGGGGDGTASFDGETVRLTWNWKAEESKTAGGAVTLPLAEVTGVRWMPAIGLENGSLRFDRGGVVPASPAKFDPYSLELWGLSKREYTAVLVAAAVLVRMPAPAEPTAPAVALEAAPAPGPAPSAPPADDHDVLLRRLRELGELHEAGILTDEEFATAKQAVLKRL